ncbi:MAG: hypothetical protein ACYC5H_06365, partial [Methylovirgula sp.]
MTIHWGGGGPNFNDLRPNLCLPFKVSYSGLGSTREIPQIHERHHSTAELLTHKLPKRLPLFAEIAQHDTR